MPEKVKGYVKWFSNRKGFGFITPTSDNAPTTDDIFVHQSSIVTDAEHYRTLKDGFEAEFEVVTDDTGKLKAMNVTSADGSPCPGPEPRKRRPKKKDAKDTASEDDDGAATSGDDKENGKEDEAGENGDKTKKPRRRRRNGAKKPSGKPSSGGEEAKKEEPSWEKGLDESVQKVMESKNVTIDGGRAFLAIGDARVKLGTDAYAALAHSTAVLAEGKWTVVPSGVVTVTWERVLKLSGDEWVPSTVEAEKAVLLTEIKLADASVKPTDATETTATLWGKDKADPKEALEKHGFQMRKMILNASQAVVRRRRGRGRRFGNKNGNGKPAAATKQ